LAFDTLQTCSQSLTETATPHTGYKSPVATAKISLKQLYTVQGATKDRVLPTLRIYPASTDFILDLIFWKALVRMESDVFTVDDRIPNPCLASQAFDKEQVTLLCRALAVVSAALI